LEGAPPLSGMDVPPAPTAPPVSTEDTPWYRGPETPPHGESPASAGLGALSPEEGAQVADQEVMAPNETDAADAPSTDHQDQP
jgi:hypothetical protein